jgi:hypothetical protein
MEYTKIEAYVLASGTDTRVTLIPSGRIVRIDPLIPASDPNYRDSFTGQANETIRRQSFFDKIDRNPYARSVMFVDEGQGSSGSLMRYYMPQSLEEIARRAPGLVVLTDAPDSNHEPTRGAGPARAEPVRGPSVA